MGIFFVGKRDHLIVDHRHGGFRDLGNPEEAKGKAAGGLDPRITADSSIAFETAVKAGILIKPLSWPETFRLTLFKSRVGLFNERHLLAC